MANDQQTYKRAANAALIGGGTQLVLAVMMALIGLYAQAPAIHAATWQLFGGLPIWLILWVLFHQHQLERVEALEAEQLSKEDARTAALFDEAGQQLAIARQRLESLNRWWLPIVSLVVAGYQIIVGGSLLYLGYRAQQAGTLRGDAINETAAGNLGVLFTVLLVIGFVAFLVARYVAGMTRLRDWTLLRGGASYLMGGVVVAALLVAGVAALWFGNVTFFASLAMVIPGLMVLLGLEMLLGFIFGLYRPRRPGDIDRPAFDLRSLGWLTRPESLGKIINEAVNYQFGFEISRSWFYRLLSKAIVPLILIGAAVLIGLTSVVLVAPQQQAVIMRFGAFQRVVDEPGLTFKWPWPVESVDKYDVYRVHEVAIGSEPGELRPGVPILWTNQHAESTESYMVTAPTRLIDEEDLGVQSVAGELAGARVIVKYRVSDLEAYVTSAREPARVLETLATRQVNYHFVTHDIDSLLTGGRLEGAVGIREAIQAQIDAFDPPLGIEVVFVGFEAIHPPQESEVAAAFHEQIDARQKRASAVEDARKEAITTLAEVAGSQDMALRIDEAIAELNRIRGRINEAGESGEVPDDLAALEAQQEVEIERLLDEAGGQAAQMIYEARAYRWSHALTERARAMAVRSQYESYHQAPEYFQRRMYLQAVSEALRDRRKFVIAGDPEGTKDIRLELQQEGVDLGGLFGEE